jgi:hypothetical protein
MLTPDSVLLFTLLFGVAWAIVNFVFAIGVFQDSSRLQSTGREIRIVPGPMWAFATLVGGVLVAVAYWFIHHSTLSDRD